MSEDLELIFGNIFERFRVNNIIEIYNSGRINPHELAVNLDIKTEDSLEKLMKASYPLKKDGSSYETHCILVARLANWIADDMTPEELKKIEKIGLEHEYFEVKYNRTSSGTIIDRDHSMFSKIVKQFKRNGGSVDSVILSEMNVDYGVPRWTRKTHRILQSNLLGNMMHKIVLMADALENASSCVYGPEVICSHYIAPLDIMKKEFSDLPTNILDRVDLLETSVLDLKNISQKELTPYFNSINRRYDNNKEIATEQINGLKSILSSVYKRQLARLN